MAGQVKHGLGADGTDALDLDGVFGDKRNDVLCALRHYEIEDVGGQDDREHLLQEQLHLVVGQRGVKAVKDVKIELILVNCMKNGLLGCNV